MPPVPKSELFTSSWFKIKIWPNITTEEDELKILNWPREALVISEPAENMMTVNLNRLKDAKIDDETLFWGVSLKMFSKKIHFWVSGLSEENHPLQCDGFIQLVEGLNKTNNSNEGPIHFSAWEAETSIFWSQT